MSLNKKIDKLVEKKIKEEELEEASTTGGGEAYDSKYGFGKNKPGTEENSGYKKVKTESKFMKMAKQTLLGEISYKEYKANPESTSKQKVNRAVREINSRLFKIERIINQNIKLKTEDGVDANKYWKSTRANLQKISEKMTRIGERLRKF